MAISEILSESGFSGGKDVQDEIVLNNHENPEIKQIMIQTKWS
jgi:hypothetical protein